MKKLKKLKYLLFLILIFALKSSTYASVSDDFKFVIDTIGIPQYNVYNEEINEQIYYTYNVFVYSNPIRIAIQTSLQRFKAVPLNGKWTLNGEKYVGQGVQGEYNILGRGYSGNYIYNVYFPVDAVPETTPDKWEYIDIPGAYESWQDQSKYKYIEQLDYMKNTSLLFDELDYTKNTSNPYNLVSYNITANKLGLSKVMLNTCSTWKAMGIVTVKRKNNKGQIRDATMATAPMEASANIISGLEVNDNYVMGENEDYINIPIKFSSQVTNLKNYANIKHIKEITSVIYINDKEVARVSGSKTVSVDKNILFTVTRDDSPQNIYPVKIKVLSYLYTEFSVDGLIKNTVEKTINVNIKPKKINSIEEISVGNLIKDNINKTLAVSPLVQTINTKLKYSLGFIEAGKHLALKLKLNNKSDNIEIYLDNLKLNISKVYESDKFRVYDLLIPDDTSVTLKSWKYIRNYSDNYFNVKNKDIGIRIRDPYILKIYQDGIWNNENYKKLDILDNYIDNINFEFSNEVINKAELDYKLGLKEWVNEK